MGHSDDPRMRYEIVIILGSHLGTAMIPDTAIKI